MRDHVRNPASWVIVRLSDGQAVMETFSKATAEAVDPAKAKAVPIIEWLGSLNAPKTKAPYPHHKTTARRCAGRENEA